MKQKLELSDNMFYAFTQSLTFIDLSFSYDTLTIYTDKNKNFEEDIYVTITECHKLGFIRKQNKKSIHHLMDKAQLKTSLEGTPKKAKRLDNWLTNYQNTQAIKKVIVKDEKGQEHQILDAFLLESIEDEQTLKDLSELYYNDLIQRQRSLVDISSNKNLFERFVNNYDDDHLLYHQDGFDRQRAHSHLKFKSIPTYEQFQFVLSIFCQNGLISYDEKIKLLENFLARYQQCREKIAAILTGNKQEDTSTIIQVIKQCKQNDILIDIHHYLQEDRFFYLREIGIETSPFFAMIEKSIALQLEHNIKEQTSFNKSVASDHAKKLETYPFVPISRKKKANLYSAHFFYFKEGNVSEFEKRYEKHFNKVQDKINCNRLAPPPLT